MSIGDRLSLKLSNAEKLREYISCLEINSKVYKFNNQDYYKIKLKCKEENRLFTDDTFNLNESIKNINDFKDYKIVWQRPIHINKNPKFKIKNSRGVVQGILGNCWLIAAFSSLVSQSKLFKKVVPFADKQTFNHNDYCGIFVFRFWRFGYWIEVVIDDFLPTIENKLAFAHSEYENEFWCALLEKAYAKINNGYSNLEGGHVEALIHFSGSIPEYIELKNKNITESGIKSLWNKIVYAFNSNSLMTTCIEAKNEDEVETELPNGLLIGHSYAVTGIKNLFINNKLYHLLRLTNPWRKKEWKGNWSKNSKEWKFVPNKIKQKMEFTHKENGEFWMNLNDYFKEFSELVICHNLNKSWYNRSFKENFIYGYWRKPDRCGGCINHKNDSFLANPQYRFDITKPNGDDVIICLTQKNKRSDWERGLKNLHIGFYITPIEINRTIRISSIENELNSLETPLQNSESIMLRTKLNFGRYCIIPHTFDKFQEGEFLLRIFTHKNCYLKELETSLSVHLNRKFSIPPECVTKIFIKKGYNLKFNNYPSFILISCEGQIVKSNIVISNKIHEWNVSGIFYRRNYQLNPITVALYTIEPFGILTREKYVGSVFLKAEPNDTTVEFVATLSNVVKESKNIYNKIKMNLVNGVIKSMREPYVI